MSWFWELIENDRRTNSWAIIWICGRYHNDSKAFVIIAANDDIIGILGRLHVLVVLVLHIRIRNFSPENHCDLAVLGSLAHQLNDSMVRRLYLINYKSIRNYAFPFNFYLKRRFSSLLTTLWPSMLRMSSPVAMRGLPSADPFWTMCPTATCEPSSVPPTIRNPKPDDWRRNVISDNKYP